MTKINQDILLNKRGVFDKNCVLGNVKGMEKYIVKTPIIFCKIYWFIFVAI